MLMLPEFASFGVVESIVARLVDKTFCNVANNGWWPSVPLKKLACDFVICRSVVVTSDASGVAFPRLFHGVTSSVYCTPLAPTLRLFSVGPCCPVTPDFPDTSDVVDNPACEYRRCLFDVPCIILDTQIVSRADTVSRSTSFLVGTLDVLPVYYL